MEQKIQRVVRRLFLPAVIRIFIEMQRQPCHRLRKYPDAGVHRRHLHGGTFIDTLAAGAAAHEKAIGAAGSPVLRGVPRPEQSAE